MSERKHTPGPWRANLHGSVVTAAPERGVHCTNGVAEPQVAMVMVPPVDNGTAEQAANARLIAAAPDLLAAAERVLADLNYRIDGAIKAGVHVPVFDGIADLHAAVAEAEGTP